jgi:hypothetical protein
MAKKSDAENGPTKKKQNSATGDVTSESPVPAEHGLSDSETHKQISRGSHNDLCEEQTKPPVEKIERLIDAFSNKDGGKRRKARMALVAIGKVAVPYLVKAMRHRKAEVRWQTIKALGAIGDPRSGPDMVSALTDKNFEIRWLAAEGLIALKTDALEPLLRAVSKTPDSWELRQGVHHVLHALERSHLLNKSCIEFLDELRGLDQELSVPLAADAALGSLLKSRKQQSAAI